MNHEKTFKNNSKDHKQNSKFKNFFSIGMKLQNDKHAHHLIESFPMAPKTKQGPPRFERVTT
jgi:hypothetical protein